MDHKKYCLVSGTLFSLVASAHILRIVYNLTVTVDVFAVPMIVSWIGVIVTSVLATWAFRLSR